jgi:hypothetical protein
MLSYKLSSKMREQLILDIGGHWTVLLLPKNKANLVVKNRQTPIRH